MSKRDYYEVLGVTRTCTEVELKAAFRKLAMQHHPDRNPGDKDCEHRFKEINEAYDVLKDGDKRAAYDRFGHAAFEHGGMGGGAHGFGADFGSTFADIFEGIFGMGSARGRGTGRERGSDLRYNMEISLDEAFTGKTAQIRIPTSVTCEACSGSGAKAGTKPKQCATCGGAGKIRHAQGFFTLERTCPTCHGRGQVIDDPCKVCGGGGRVTRERTLSVNIPTGVEDGTRIRLAGEGEAGCAVARPATSIFFWKSRRTSFSSATEPICTAACRSPWPARRSAANSRCRRSTAARPRSRSRQGHRPAGASAWRERVCRCCARNKLATCTFK